MAKNGISKVKNWIYIILGSIVLASMFAGGVIAWSGIGDTMATHDQMQAIELKAIVADADNLELEGCKPAKKNTQRYDLVEYRLNELQTTQLTMQKDMSEMRTEQKEGLQEILSRLSK